MKAAVVGAGIAGIAVAIRLAIKGYEVDVFEANPYPGGKLSELRLGDFRFDAGPSLFTLPHLVDDLFRLAGKEPARYFRHQALEVACHYFYEDGTRFQAHADAETFSRTVEQHLGVPARVVRDHLRDCERKYELTRGLFLERSLHKAGTYFSRDVLRALVNLPRLNLGPSMHRINAKKLKEPRLVQLFDRFATYNGSNPYRASAVMNLIPHLEHNIGASYPEGGMHAITQSLVRLATELGVRFHLGQGVERILVAGKRVTGVQVAGQPQLADLVVSNMDVVPTYRKLLPGEKAPERVLSHERSSSALIFYWGIQAEFPELGLHNILFSEDYQTEFAHIFEHGTVYEDPTIYINISSKMDAADAPAGAENWFVMVNVPSDQGQDWEALIPHIRSQVLTKLSRMLGKDIAPLIVEEDYLDPRRIQLRTSSHGGALYGASSNSRMAAFLRHANFHSRLKNLYFCGGSVHPGGGIPLCLLSAKIVADTVPAA